MVTIKLTDEQARFVWMNADGWMDAGACEGGLREDENEALQSLCTQIINQLPEHKKEGKKRKK